MQKKRLKDYKIDGFIDQRMVYLPGGINKQVLNDPRVSDLYVTHIGIFPKAYGHLRSRPLGCRQYIMLYCYEGEGWVEIGEKRTTVKKNQLFVIEPKTPCKYGSDLKNPWTNYWIHFAGKNASLYTPPTNQLIEIPPSADSRIDERILLFEEILQNLEGYLLPEKVVYANICLKHFLSSVKYINLYRSVKPEVRGDTLHKAISYMKNNLGTAIKIPELAAICNCSPSNLYRIFRNQLNSSPQDYYIHLKMERACKYLMHTNLRMKDIAVKLGYDDPYYFSRLFKKHMGTSPTHFKNEEQLSIVQSI